MNIIEVWLAPSIVIPGGATGPLMVRLVSMLGNSLAKVTVPVRLNSMVYGLPLPLGAQMSPTAGG
jgi:hypothetical protein